MSVQKCVSIEMSGHVALVKFSNPPTNFITLEALEEFQAAFRSLEEDSQCRAIVIAAEGKVFCAGADFTAALAQGIDPGEVSSNFYSLAMTFFETRKPMVAAVEGAAVGAGFGLTLVADFRVSCTEATFSANFTRLGISPGFGMSVTLPRIVGINNAELLFYTGRRIKGDEAMKMGLLTELVERGDVLTTAMELAAEIAVCSPLAVQDTRASLRKGLAEQIRLANKQEQALQSEQMATEDFREGIAAYKERRTPEFCGR